MEPVSLLVLVGIPLAAAGLRYAWKRWGKKALDNPKTKTDESNIFDPAVEALIGTLVTYATAQAKGDKSKVSATAIVGEVQSRFHGLRSKDLIARVNRALGR